MERWLAQEAERRHKQGLGVVQEWNTRSGKSPKTFHTRQRNSNLVKRK